MIEWSQRGWNREVAESAWTYNSGGFLNGLNGGNNIKSMPKKM